MRGVETIHPLLPPMRRASRNGRLYVGPCPFCADGGDDRFHVWMASSDGRPAERYWCRVCDRRGLLTHLGREDHPPPARSERPVRPFADRARSQPEPNPAHIPHYRALYTATALWAHAWLLDPCYPDARAYLRRRGLDDTTITRYVLGATLRDPQALVDHLRDACPESFPYAEAAGLLVTDDQGRLRTHWNLCGRIVFPYIADGQVVDLRTRTYDTGKGYRSLGPYAPRGALMPFGWDSLRPGTPTVIVAEAEIKALAALQAYHAGELAYPTIGQPGLTLFRDAWAQALVDRGVTEVVLCYDAQPRPVHDGLPSLAPEEQWSLRHGAVCAAAGLQVRVARLPLADGETKAEIDTFIPQAGAAAFQRLIATAPLLREVHQAISRTLLERHHLPLPPDYPAHRPRPVRGALAEHPAPYGPPSALGGDRPFGCAQGRRPTTDPSAALRAGDRQPTPTSTRQSHTGDDRRPTTDPSAVLRAGDGRPTTDPSAALRAGDGRRTTDDRRLATDDRLPTPGAAVAPTGDQGQLASRAAHALVSSPCPPVPLSPCPPVPVSSQSPGPPTLAETREAITARTAAHAARGQGFLVLAHPPGSGKGHNTTLGLQRWRRDTPAGDDGSGFLVWTGPRTAQIADQQGLDLIPLSGRGPQNCRKLPEAATLAQKGYRVKEALCLRRCPHLDHCRYLRQFDQQGDFFATTPLLQATGWWHDAGVVVLDEFDPTSLIRLVALTAADLAAMSRAHPGRPAIQSLLRWVAQAIATTTDRTLVGTLVLDELAQQAARDRADLDAILAAALSELPPAEQRDLLIGLPNGATLADYQALPPGHTATLLEQLAAERRAQRAGQRRTSRIAASGGRLTLFLRQEHLIAQLARPEQPKIILDATANPDLLRALFPAAPIQVERPALPAALRVVQVVGRDWAKTTLRGDDRQAAARQARWFDAVARHIRPGRPTLVVCTAAWEPALRAALVARGHLEVVVAHYGALRGANAYLGHDVILAQVYHPNREQIVAEGRALFADDPQPLDERMVLEPRALRDATGATWTVPVPTFADPRLAALLHQRREAELYQCALRGRPFDHPDTQITLLFSLPLPDLPPTLIRETPASPVSNAGRTATATEQLCATARQLLAQGARVIAAGQLAAAAQVSVVTVRKHWGQVAARLHLRLVRRRRAAPMPRGGVRHHERMVLVCRGRWVPPAVERPAPEEAPPAEARPGCEETLPAGTPIGAPMCDHARDRSRVPRLIRRRAAAQRARRRPRLGRRGRAPP